MDLPCYHENKHNIQKAMNFFDLTASISDNENIPTGKVRKISKALLERMALACDSGEKLQLPTIVFLPKTLPEREANGNIPWRPERKVAEIFRKPTQPEG